MRLGCGPQILGKPGLHSYDGRHGSAPPHFSVALVALRTTLAYLLEQRITMYRMGTNLLATTGAFLSMEDMHLLEECGPELAAIGQQATVDGFRLSFHAPAAATLATTISEARSRSIQEIEMLATILNRMAMGPDSVVVVHVGGTSGDIEGAIRRWIQGWEALSADARGRIVLEHDHVGIGLGVVLRIHAATGVPVVFDHLHWLLHNPERMELQEAVTAALNTWPTGVQPKVHFATPHTELRAALKSGRSERRRRWTLAPPRPGHHSDFVHPWEFARFIETAAGLPDFDIMVEAKASDVAIHRLRADLQRYVPEALTWLQDLEADRP